MKDSTFRTLHYVNVSYFKDKIFVDCKLQYYPVTEAGTIYMRTINKMKEEKAECIVALREENHMLIKAERLNF